MFGNSEGAAPGFCGLERQVTFTFSSNKASAQAKTTAHSKQDCLEQPLHDNRSWAKVLQNHGKGKTTHIWIQSSAMIKTLQEKMQ